MSDAECRVAYTVEGAGYAPVIQWQGQLMSLIEVTSIGTLCDHGWSTNRKDYEFLVEIQSDDLWFAREAADELESALSSASGCTVETARVPFATTLTPAHQKIEDKG